MLVTSIVAGVDTYQGMNCAGRTGGYIQPFPGGDAQDQRIANAVIAIPYGLVRGAIYNFGQSLNMEGSCGAGSYTVRFADGISGLFNHSAPGTVYRLNQAILGVGGAIIGGIIAEEMHVFRVPPARVTP